MSEQILKTLFTQMLRIRLVEEKIAELYPEQEMRCPVHLCIGQEAVAAGVCAAMNRNDYALSGHRSHGHYLAKGGGLKAMMAELYGKATGCCRGLGGSMHLVDLSAGFLGAAPIVGSTIPIAVGVALASKMKGEKNVTAVFFGEAATEEGVFHESINFASLKKLPVLFVCENNLYSVYSPLSVRQPQGRSVSDLARGHGVKTVRGDGNDVSEVFRLAGKAVKYARSGKGPLFLEFSTYRWREHCGPNYDNDLGYRTGQEFKRWKKRCPVNRLERRLTAERICTPGEVKEMSRKLRVEIEDAVRFAKESPFPEPDLISKYEYAP